MADDEKIPTSDDNIVTAIDIVDQQTALEQEAHEVLPGKFEACTFDKGYIRQPLYACRTCNGANSDPAGMCYSCSIACHAEHELFELFPKRNFRCDCGIPDKFGGHRCQLLSRQKQRAVSNDKNAYNHNFHGHYCRCDKFYDPEVDKSTMYQCVLCEDWFHDECIGDIPSDIEDFESYICRECTEKHPFLVQHPSSWVTLGLSVGSNKIHQWIKADKASDNTTPSALSKNASDTISSSSLSDNANDSTMLPTAADAANNSNTAQSSGTENSNGNSATQSAGPDSSNTLGEKRKALSEEKSTSEKRTRRDIACKRATYPDRVELFLNQGWRERLCQCSDCKAAFVEHDISFLLSDEETFEPENDEDAGKSLLEIGMEQMMHMDRVQAIESILAYQRFETQIKDFLRGFAGSGEVVTSDDIHQFFAEKCQNKDPQNDT